MSADQAPRQRQCVRSDLPPIVVADIGGTNARFGVVHFSPELPGGGCRDVHTFTCKQFPDVIGLLDAYLTVLPHKPLHACFAVAGPVRNGVGHLTNVGFELEESRLARHFGFKRLALVNDFAALASSIVYLTPDDYLTVQHGHTASQGPISVMRAGTGFGAALLTPHDHGWSLTATEAGHQSFAPVDNLDLEVFSILRETEPRISIESLLSGPGLSRIHAALMRIQGRIGDRLPPEEIGLRAATGSDHICSHAIDFFFSLLGSTAGDIALTHGATGGVYLAGGVLVKNASCIAGSDFCSRFTAKGPMSRYAENIPVRIIHAEHAALLGAAHWFFGQGQETRAWQCQSQNSANVSGALATITTGAPGFQNYGETQEQCDREGK